MRPLTVLILILGALAALAFAVISLTSNDVRGEGAAGPRITAPSITPTGPGVTTPTDLRGPDRVVPPTGTLTPEGTTDRVAVESAAGSGTWANLLTGVVRSPEGLPLTGVEVELFSQRANPALSAFRRMVQGGLPDKPDRVQTTGREGLFQFRALQPGDAWLLTFRHPDYSYTEVGPISVPEEGTSQEDVELGAGYKIVGIVKDGATGKVVPDVRIVLDDQLSINMPGGRPGPHFQETVTAGDGTFLLPHLASQTYSLICSKPGYATLLKTNIAVMGDKDTVELEFELQEGKVLAGRVVDGTNKGVEGAVIEAISHNTTRDKGLSRGRTVSGKDGEFLIDDVFEGMFTLTVQADGYQSEPTHRVESGNTNIVLRVSRQGSIMGRVVDDVTGQPITEFQVRVRAVNPQTPALRARGRVSGQATVRGAADGRFTVNGVSEGTYAVQANARGYANSFSTRFVVNEGQATPDVEVRMTKGGKIVGTVLDAKTRQPVSGVNVSTHDNNWIDSEFTNLLGALNDPSVAHQKVKTGADGKFELQLLTSETYQVKFESPEHTLVLMNDIEVVDGSSRDLGVTMLSRGAIVSGTVYLADGGVGKGITVYLQPADGSYSSNLQARTDGDGRFRLRNASPGTYKLSASRAANQGNPFQTIVDMKHSEVEVMLLEGGDVKQDLYIGGE